MYVFDRTDGAWRQTALLTGSRSQQNDGLANSGPSVTTGTPSPQVRADEQCLTWYQSSGLRWDTAPVGFGQSFSAGGVYFGLAAETSDETERLLSLQT